MMKRIVLCADDYGQAQAVSDGILDLLADGRLTAVSCMVNQFDWMAHAKKLRPFSEVADLGLHLNFTYGVPLASDYREVAGHVFLPLSRLLIATMTGATKLTRKILAAEIAAQIDAFEMGVGYLPRFIDGHQHIHHLPMIRDALIDVYRKKFTDSKVYIRTVTQHLRAADIFKGFKKVVIAYTGGRDFAAYLDRFGIPHNSSFAGIYSFQHAQHYRQYFQGFLAASRDRGLIMCHPGHLSSDAKDPIRCSRVAELEYLKSHDFITDCARYGVTLSRFAYS